MGLAGASLLSNPSLSVLTNGVGLTAERGEPRRRDVLSRHQSTSDAEKELVVEGFSFMIVDDC